MKRFAYLLMAMLLVTHSEATAKGGKNKAKEAAEKKAREERDDRREAVNSVLAAKDSNNDGSLTLDEYLSNETDKDAAKEKFDKFNKNNDRYLTKSEIADSIGK